MINKTQNRAVAMARSLFKQEVQAETSSSTSLSMPRYSLVVMHLKASEISLTLFLNQFSLIFVYILDYKQ